MRLAARSILACVAVAACGGPTAAKRPAPLATKPDASATSTLPTLDAGANDLALLVAKGERLAPGARQIASRELDPSHDHELALAVFDADTCIRAAFHASAPTAVALVSSSGMTLATADAPEGVIGPSGPICFRKGEAATLRFTGASPLQIVVWATP